jgi:hypothetical protein
MNLDFEKFNHIMPCQFVRVFFCKIFCKPNILLIKIKGLLIFSSASISINRRLKMCYYAEVK